VNKTDIFSSIVKIMREEFGNDDLNVTMATSADDVDDWDSMTHLQLISRVEKQFKVRFALGELQAMKNVGDLVDLVEKKAQA
jgi:acyl carrier protein